MAVKKKKKPIKMVGVLTSGNIDTLAELYVSVEKWKEYNPEEKAQAKEVILGMIDALAKIGFEPRPLGEHLKERATKKLVQAELGEFIKEWIKKNVTVPKNLDGVFPSSELGAQILKKFKVSQDA